MYCLSHLLLFIVLVSVLILSSHCSGFVFLQSSNRVPSTFTSRGTRSLVRFYANSTISEDNQHMDETLKRFQREAAKKQDIDEECILTIHGNQYNMTAWANAHPGNWSSIE